MSYLVSCKNGYLEGIEPFSNHIRKNELYEKLCFLADQLSLDEFTGYLVEGQYFINLWTAIIILDRFRPKTSEKLIGLNNNKSIAEDCLETIEQYSDSFKQDGQFDNYQKWILEIKSSYS
jgi:hypothetical protein